MSLASHISATVPLTITILRPEGVRDSQDEEDHQAQGLEEGGGERRRHAAHEAASRVRRERDCPLPQRGVSWRCVCLNVFVRGGLRAVSCVATRTGLRLWAVDEAHAWVLVYAGARSYRAREDFPRGSCPVCIARIEYIACVISDTRMNAVDPTPAPSVIVEIVVRARDF